MAIKPIFETVEELKTDLENLSVEALDKELEKSDDAAPLLLDIREIQEQVDLGTIPGAVHVPRGMLEFWADPDSPYYRDYFTADKRIVLFCAGGGRSAFAARALLDMGFRDVAHLEDGFTGWAKADLPVEETASKSRWMRKPKDKPEVWVGHVVMPVADPAASKAFFLETGMREAEPEASVGILEMRGGTHLILVPGDQVDGADAPFDLMVEDLDASHAAYTERGLNPSVIGEVDYHRFFTLDEPGGHRVTVMSSHVVGAV